MTSPIKTDQTQTQSQNQARNQTKAGVDADSGVYRGPPGEAAQKGEASRADTGDGTRSDGDLPALEDAAETAARGDASSRREDAPSKGERH